MSLQIEQRLIAFLRKEILPQPAPPVELHTPLVSSGLVDSFALVRVLTELERITGVSIPAGRLSPQDFETVRSMLEVAGRFSRSR